MYKCYPCQVPSKVGFYDVKWSDGSISKNLWANGWHPLERHSMSVDNREVVEVVKVIGFKEE